MVLGGPAEIYAALTSSQRQTATLLKKCYHQRWVRVLDFTLLRSRVSGILGTWARGITNFVQEPGNAEREIIGKLILHSFGEI